MDEFEFEIVDNDKRNFSRYPLERLKAIAPTYAERSPQRLACVELIAEREHALAQGEIRQAAKRAKWALILSVVSLVVAVGFVIVFPILRPVPREQPVVVRRATAYKPPAPKVVVPVEVPPEREPEPLPPLLSAPPPTRGGQ
ncbi:MAG: hypothetical protein WCG52_01530 [bacterium]|jgi:hypothetical protein|nr:hypothetical protein [bacterium]NBS52195.1 hypothetical protein [Spartobacteria bacterium]